MDKVWGTLKAFGSFGFCKAHGAAFAVPTYQSAWLKAHHPEAFLAGLWEHDPGMYPKRLLVAEARRLGIPILPLDINRSQAEYRVERVTDGPDAGKLGIRLSLNGIYGLSGAELKRIVAGQPYDSLADLRARSRLSKPSINGWPSWVPLTPCTGSRAAPPTAQTSSSTCNSCGPPAVPGRASSVIEGQLSLPLGDVELRNVKPGLPAPTLVEKVRAELDLMAIDVSAHLMDSHRPLLDRLGVTTADNCWACATAPRCWWPGSGSPPRPRPCAAAGGWCSSASTTAPAAWTPCSSTKPRSRPGCCCSAPGCC